MIIEKQKYQYIIYKDNGISGCLHQTIINDAMQWAFWPNLTGEDLRQIADELDYINENRSK